MSSSSSSSSSSAAAATVAVTARDIEFSNYNSSTGKWGNAVFTMMIEDTDTADNINMEVYNEKVYAVFRNHDDPTDLVQTSAEVDGMDFRVTISTPMVASAKYELYKVYGETSHSEYATTSQFYIQVPGKVWDFTNDTVDHDVELVSDWWNYGYYEDVNGNKFKMPTLEDAETSCILYTNDSATLTVNGQTLPKDDIKKVKLTSAVTGDFATSKSGFAQNYYNLEEIDIVSTSATRLGVGFYFGGVGINQGSITQNTKNIKKFALPNTLTKVTRFMSNRFAFDRPVYFPDSISEVGELTLSRFVQYSGIMSFNSKIHFPNNPNGVTLGSNILNQMAYYNQPIVWPEKIVKLGHQFLYQGSGFGQDFAFPDPTYLADKSVPSNWLAWQHGTNLPANAAVEVTIPEGYTNFSSSSSSLFYDGIQSSKFSIKKINFASTLETIGDIPTMARYSSDLNFDFATITPNLKTLGTIGSYMLYGSGRVSKVTLPEGLTSFSGFGGQYIYRKGALDDFEFPSTLTSINYFFQNSAIQNLDRFNDQNNPIKFPSTLTTIRNTSLSGIIDNSQKTLYLDLSESDPSYWPNDQYSSSVANAAYNTFGSKLSQTSPPADTPNITWHITVAPGTTEDWEAKYPNTSYDLNGVNVVTRYIEWVEKPTPYGYVFYKTSANAREEYVELQSQAEFESFVNPAYNSGWSTTVGEDQITLYASDTVYPKITGVTIGTNITSIPNKFMYGASALTRARGGDAVTSIGSNFCQSTKINNTINFPLVTTVGGNFLAGCKEFNKTVSLPNATSIGASFLEGDSIYNQPFTFPSGITTVPNNFMRYCVRFDQPLSIPNGVTAIGEGFLLGGSSATSNMDFNSALTIPSTVTSIGQYFMNYCKKFNQPLTIPASSIGQAFLYHCTGFNQPITLTASSISSLAGFMSNCTSFNQPLDLSMVNSLERSSQTSGGLLRSATSFNSDITFKQQMYKFEYMFDGWTSFNRPVTLPTKVTSSFNGAFFSNCPNFDQDVVMPVNTVNYGNYAYFYLFKDCKNMKSTVTFSNNTFPSGGTFISNSFTTTDATADCYTSGINITGASAATLKNLLPDSDTSPYRKINLI